MCSHRAVYVVNGHTSQCSQSEHEVFEGEFIHQRLKRFSHISRNNPGPNGFQCRNLLAHRQSHIKKQQSWLSSGLMGEALAMQAGGPESEPQRLS